MAKIETLVRHSLKISGQESGTGRATTGTAEFLPMQNQTERPSDLGKMEAIYFWTSSSSLLRMNKS